VSASSPQPDAVPAAGSVTLDDYLGRIPSRPPREASPGWRRREQLPARYDWYRQMREEHPVARDPETGVWGLFRYADVRRALTDVTDFSCVIPGVRADSPLTGSMLRVDPPRHRDLRGLINQAFTSRRVAGLRRQVQRLSTELVSTERARTERARTKLARTELANDAAFDVVSGIAQVLPTLVIADLLGIDPCLRDDFQRWTSAFVQSIARTPDAEQTAALRDMRQFFTDTIAERRRVPGGDLISAAIRAELEGVRLTDRDLIQFCNLLLIAGAETTTHLITNTVLCLQQHPDLVSQARLDPAVLPAVIEEVLRYLSPVQAAPRAASRDVTMHGQVIPAGAMVFPWLGSANRDPDEFADPDNFAINRKQGKHLGFGYGIHFCVGAALARLQTEVVVTTMLAALPGQWKVPEIVTAYPAPTMCGLTSLPLQWGERAGPAQS
jgi:cytochrome P450